MLEKKTITEKEDQFRSVPGITHPHFQVATAAMMMKDTELERIVQNDRRFRSKVEVLTKHYEENRQVRANLGIFATYLRIGQVHCQTAQETLGRECDQTAKQKEVPVLCRLSWKA